MDNKHLDMVTSPDSVKEVFATLSELISGFRKFIFSSRFIVRPESDHPLTIMAASYLATQNYPRVNTVIGLPAGSRALACTIAEAYEHEYANTTNLIYLPFSLHSFKRLANETNGLPALIQHNASEIDGKEVLLVDDNTSTGRTLQAVVDAISENTTPKDIHYMVPEADIIRSKLDIHNPKRTHVANPNVYS